MTSALIARAKEGRVNLFSWVKWLLTALGEQGVENTGGGEHWNELLPHFATSEEILCPTPPLFVICVTKCLRRSIQKWLLEHYWSRRPASYQLQFQGCQQLSCHPARPSTHRRARYKLQKNYCFNLCLFWKGLLALQGHRRYLRAGSTLESSVFCLMKHEAFL